MIEVTGEMCIQEVEGNEINIPRPKLKVLSSDHSMYVVLELSEEIITAIREKVYSKDGTSIKIDDCMQITVDARDLQKAIQNALNH